MGGFTDSHDEPYIYRRAFQRNTSEFFAEKSRWRDTGLPQHKITDSSKNGEEIKAVHAVWLPTGD
jgi:hypothetical protein